MLYWYVVKEAKEIFDSVQNLINEGIATEKNFSDFRPVAQIAICSLLEGNAEEEVLRKMEKYIDKNGMRH